MSIWSKLIIKETLKIFLFFIVSLYFLYSLIDYSSRIDYYNNLPTLSVLHYYLCILSQKMELLIPFAFMVTLIKVLTSLNSHNELVSMLMSGKSYKNLLRPLFIFAALLSATLYLNFEFLEPHAQEKIARIKMLKKGRKNSKVQSYILGDNSKIVFSAYNFKDRCLEKVYWLKGSGEIYYANKLYPFSSPPIAHQVFKLAKESEKPFELIEKKDIKPLREMDISFDPLMKSIFSVRTHSISSLLKYLNSEKLRHHIDPSEIYTLLNYKLAIPLLPLFILITLAPICTRFSRNIPTFFIYLGSMILLLTFITSMDACYILSENQMIYSQIGLWIPFALFFAYPLKRFIRY